MINIATRTTCLRRFITITMCAAAVFGSSALAEHSGGEKHLRRSVTSAIERHSTAARTSICLKVVDLASGDVLFDRNGQQLMTPASNLKMYSGACALEQFGPEHRFRTKVQLQGEWKRNVFHGDIVIEGCGDPMLSSSDLNRMAAQLVETFQLESVLGEVRVDNSRYDATLKGPGWMWDDEPHYFNMPVTPTMVDFNVLNVRIDPSSNSARMTRSSEYPPLLVKKHASNSKLSVTRWPFTEPIVVTGIAKSREPSEHRLTMHDPGLWVAGMFKEMLKSLGVEFRAPAKVEVDSPHLSGSTRELIFSGQRLREVLNHFQEESENAIGEMLLHEIAIANGVERPVWRDGAKAITSWLVETAGLEPQSFRLVDGSGLSRYNLISADSSVRLLQYMHTSKHAKTFIEGLPVYEIKRPDATALEDHVYAKGGSMSGVSTCSGYVRTIDNHWLAFSYLTNGFIGASDPQKELRNEIWNILVRFGDDPLP